MPMVESALSFGVLYGIAAVLFGENAEQGRSKVSILWDVSFFFKTGNTGLAEWLGVQCSSGSMGFKSQQRGFFFWYT